MAFLYHKSFSAGDVPHVINGVWSGSYGYCANKFASPGHCGVCFSHSLHFQTGTIVTRRTRSNILIYADHYQFRCNAGEAKDAK